MCQKRHIMNMPSSQKIDKEIFRTIFIDHWESFKDRHPGYDTSQYGNPVQKMHSVTYGHIIPKLTTFVNIVTD